MSDQKDEFPEEYGFVPLSEDSINELADNFEVGPSNSTLENLLAIDLTRLENTLDKAATQKFDELTDSFMTQLAELYTNQEQTLIESLEQTVNSILEISKVQGEYGRSMVNNTLVMLRIRTELIDPLIPVVRAYIETNEELYPGEFDNLKKSAGIEPEA